ncbi:MAG: peptidase M61 [Chitinophagales bacterium]|jgi:predicted metalloprotease with PDZ domain|nr:peptidase M61 [Bacteroidota bacterium]MBP8250151.1 peptidase M61 [Chitinophagales bacterium]MBP9879821.1 peptidase M61 [Chitinophagales bacterium]
MRNFLLLLLGLSGIAARATEPTSNIYTATIDLTVVENDRVKVTIDVPEITSDNIFYCIPKIVPGTYNIYDFGRFVFDFKAYNENGVALKVEPVDVNRYKIFNATTLKKIEYWIDDTYDMTGDNPIFEPAGTNIAPDNFVVNTFGFIGYLDGMKENDYELIIKKPAGFYGSTPLKAKSVGTNLDKFHLDDYDHLADSPLLYAVPDTASTMVGNAQVLIGVYSPNKVITAKQIMDNVSEILAAQGEYLGGKLPVDKYAFLLYFTDTTGVSGGMGALEHKNSSVYFLPETEIENIAPMLRDVCAHEFFHVVTPLAIHSREIADFNFIEPKMSKHLWLYEGQTEYAAHHAQVKAGLITHEEFISRMQGKIENSTSYYNDTLPFTTMSLGCLDIYHEEYGNVYLKGALINMCLDIELRQLSKGKYGTQELMRDLGKEFGANKAFNDDELFDKITKMTYPEIRTFFTTYVEGDTPIPYETYLKKAGISLSPEGTMEVISMGNISMNYNITAESSTIFIENLEGSNSFAKDMGYKVGDKFLSINGQSLTAGNADRAINAWKQTTKAGDKVVVMVERKLDNGKVKKVKLKGNAITVKVPMPRNLMLDEQATPEQLAFRKAWLG